MEKQSKSLFDISKEQFDLIQQIEELEGEITPEIEEQLAINESNLQVKAIAYLEVMDKKDAFIKRIDAEIKRLQALKKRENNIIDRLKGSLLAYVKMHGSFETKFHKFGTRKSQSVQVDDVNQLPKEYKTITVTEQADKTKIKNALKNGEKIKGCSLQDNVNLSIK